MSAPAEGPHAAFATMWRCDAVREESVALESGLCLSVPLGAAFLLRCDGDAPRVAVAVAVAVAVTVAVAVPPWPGEGEAIVMPGPFDSGDLPSPGLR